MPKQFADQTRLVGGLGRVDHGPDRGDAGAIHKPGSILPLPAQQYPAYFHRTGLYASTQVILLGAGWLQSWVVCWYPVWFLHGATKVNTVGQGRQLDLQFLHVHWWVYVLCGFHVYSHHQEIQQHHLTDPRSWWVHQNYWQNVDWHLVRKGGSLHHGAVRNIRPAGKTLGPVKTFKSWISEHECIV